MIAERDVVAALAGRTRALIDAVEEQGEMFIDGASPGQRDLAALARVVELRELLVEVEARVVNRAQRRSRGGVSDAALARALGMSTSAFSRRHGQDIRELNAWQRLQMSR